MIILYILAALGIVVVSYILFLAICSLFVDPKKEYEHQSRFYRSLLNNATGVTLKLLRIRVHVSGMEQLPDDVRPLFVCNHRSNYDPIVTWYAFRKWQPAFVSKGENFKIPIFGRIIRRCCFMEIDRVDPRKAMKTITHAADVLRNQEVSIGVYPGGTRSKTGTLLPFHSGVLKIAQKAEAPIVVLSIRGTERIAKNLPFRASDVFLDVLEVIPADDFKHVRSAVIGERVRSRIDRSLKDQ